MASINSFKDLQVWQHGMDLSVQAYQLTSSFPKAEMFGLTSQVRRAAASVPANIAEGWGREGTREFIQFLRMAKGSLSELETHLLLAERLQMLGHTPEVFQRITLIGKMIHGLIGSLQRRMPLQKGKPIAAA